MEPSAAFVLLDLPLTRKQRFVRHAVELRTNQPTMLRVHRAQRMRRVLRVDTSRQHPALPSIGVAVTVRPGSFKLLERILEQVVIFVRLDLNLLRPPPWIVLAALLHRLTKLKMLLHPCRVLH